MKIAYITFARIPTEKAHGLQIAKMCEQFGLLGHEVTLIVPKPKRINNEDVFSYYDLEKTFSLQHLTIPNLISLSPFIGSIAYKLNVFIFLLRASFLGLPKDAVVYSRTPSIAWWFAMMGRRTVHELHNWPESRLHSFVLTRMLKRVSLVVCNSKGTEAAANKHGVVDTLVAPNAVNVEDFDIEVDAAAVRERLGIPLDKKIVMYIGSLEKWKGVDTLLEASQSLPNDVQVVIIGGRDAEVEKLSAEYPNVLFLGHRPYRELAKNQKAADVLIVPNSPESIESQLYTSPIKIFAHLLSGVPILASRLPSIEAILDESNAFFFEPGNPEALEREIKNIFSKPQKAEQVANCALIHGRQFSWQNRAERIATKI